MLIGPGTLISPSMISAAQDSVIDRTRLIGVKVAGDNQGLAQPLRPARKKGAGWIQPFLCWEMICPAEEPRFTSSVEVRIPNRVACNKY
jgi:hypothetical protein